MTAFQKQVDVLCKEASAPIQQANILSEKASAPLLLIRQLLQLYVKLGKYFLSIEDICVIQVRVILTYL